MTNPVDDYEAKKRKHADAVEYVKRFDTASPWMTIKVVDSTNHPYEMPRAGADRDGRNADFERALETVVAVRFAELTAEALAVMDDKAKAAAEAARDAAKSLLAELDKP